VLHSIRKTALTVGVIGAAGLGGATLADAAGTKTTTSTQQGHEALSADVAAKVKAAALAKVPGATVLRTEAGGPNGAAYHAHIKTSDGTLQEVLVNASFEATDVVADQGRGGPGGRRGHGAQAALTGDAKTKAEAAALAKVSGATVLHSEKGGPSGAAYSVHVKTSDGTLKTVLLDASFTVTDVVADQGHGGHGGPRGDETALTGDTKTKVQAAALAKYPGATIVRSETNGDSTAPYEAHLTTSAGKQLEVLVSKDFTVVDTRERPARK
jgi:uncharacterized membrane protein YkoI